MEKLQKEIGSLSKKTKSLKSDLKSSISKNNSRNSSFVHNPSKNELHDNSPILMPAPQLTIQE
jgi:hypothetical protein